MWRLFGLVLVFLLVGCIVPTKPLPEEQTKYEAKKINGREVAPISQTNYH